MGVGTLREGWQKDLKGREGAGPEGRKLSSGGKRGKRRWLDVGRWSRPQSGSVYKVKEETNGAPVRSVFLTWG